MKTKLSLAVLSTAAVLLMPTQASAVNVSLELALVVDESSSVDSDEWKLQRDGYVSAFANPTIQNAILASSTGSIAVSYVQFDAAAQVGIGWTLLNSVASMNAFSSAIANLARFGDAGTGVANAIKTATASFFSNNFDSEKQIIDVSGDGRNNTPGDAADATDNVTDAAITAGIDRINGIVIDPDGENGLLAFYQTQVQDGPDSFTVVAETFGDFEKAVDSKILREITQPVPETGSSLLLGAMAMGVLAGINRGLRRTRRLS